MTNMDDSIAARLLERAHSNPDGEAFEWYIDTSHSTVWTWAELHRQACAQAAQIEQLAAPQSRVVLALPQGLPFIAALFGCHYARCVPVPTCPPDTAASLPRFLRIVDDCAPALLMTTAAVETKLRAHGAELPPTLYAEEIANAADANIDFEPQQPLADDIALLQYTSGTTSAPKGVMISHRNLLANEAAIDSTFPRGDAPRLVSWLPFFHDMGLIGGICYPVYTGVPATLLSTTSFLRRPVLWLHLIAQRRATISPAPNFAYDLCARVADDASVAALDLSCWCSAICGAERVRSDTVERFIERFAPAGFCPASFIPSYGMAETTLLISADTRSVAPTFIRPLHAEGEIAHASCGAPVATEVRIVDPDRCVPCAPGEVGEIWVSSASVGQGYWRQPELTRRIFQARCADAGERRFLRTGDLGFLHDGHLHVTGRLKELIILRGRNYLPQDIEGVAREAVPTLAAGQCAAFAIDCDGTEALVVALEVNPRRCDEELAECTVAGMRIALRGGLSIDADDIVLVRLNSLPRTTSGKLQRAEIRARYLAGKLDVIRPVAAVAT